MPFAISAYGFELGDGDEVIARRNTPQGTMSYVASYYSLSEGHSVVREARHEAALRSCSHHVKPPISVLDNQICARSVKSGVSV